MNRKNEEYIYTKINHSFEVPSPIGLDPNEEHIRPNYFMNSIKLSKFKKPNQNYLNKL